MQRTLITRMLPLAACGAFLVLASCGKTGSNGETIYMTGRTLTGGEVQADVDRSTLSDPSLVLTCAKCHGEDRKGRRSALPEFGPYLAPDITPAALQTEQMRRPAYDRTTLARAIRDGIGASGKRLHHPMPRWTMRESDLDDLITWLLAK